MEFVSKEVPFEIDERIIDENGFKGTVRYIGPVAVAKNTSDVWIGIEWDVNTRGKHNGGVVDASGTVIKYFECDPGCGSFIKPNLASKGRKFTEALLERYLSIDAPPVAPDAIIPDAYVKTVRGNNKNIEFVGEKLIRMKQQIEVVKKVCVRHDTVAITDEDTARIASHFVEVDLQENLIWKWIEVGKLGQFLPLMKTLCLHGNKMQPLTPEIIHTLPSHCFDHLKIVALNACNLKTFQAVLLLEPLLPNVEQFYLSSNKFEDMPSLIIDSPHTPAHEDHHPTTTEPFTGFLNLKVLDLSSCGLNNWGQILYLGRLPALVELRLDGNPISKTAKSPPGFFPSLQQITLGSTNISSWSDVDGLSSYTDLRTLRLSHIPLLLGKSSSEARVEVIGRLPTLTIFNGSTISVREKLDCERTYLRRAMRTLQELKERVAAGDKEAQHLIDNFSSQHPRLEELSSRFAADLIALSSNTGRTALSSEMVTVRLHNVTTGVMTNVEPMSKRLPQSLTIAKLKLMMKQLFGVAPHVQVLSFRNDASSFPSTFDDDDATLSYFGVAENADIFVNEM